MRNVRRVIGWRLAAMLVLLVSPGAFAQDAGPADDDAAPAVLTLWPGDPPGDPAIEGEMPPEETTDRGHIRLVSTPTLICYLPDPATANGAAVVVCPGGGYGILAMNHEGHDIARFFNEQGIAAFVLKYRHAPYRHPVPMHDAQRAMRLVRHHAEQWGVDPDRIGIMGFSAGGHLASTVATHYDAGDPDADDPVEQQSCRPDFAILGYPVIALSGRSAHAGSRHNLLGPDATDAQIAELDNHEHVDANTPPTFLFHARDDGPVPIENSEMFLAALERAGVPGMLAEQATGGHGFGMRRIDGEPWWPERLMAWLDEQGLLQPGSDAE
ncbi:MAG: alpha/beta hydrolase [Phycisphaerales bacterium JB063]